MTTAKVGMYSLPTELKQQIARCCADQDALLASALEDVRTDDDEDAATETAEARHATLRRAAAQNQSLVALATVSRQWNDLVAPFLFEVSIAAAQALLGLLLERDPPAARAPLCPPHGHVGPPRPQIRLIADLVEVLPHLPNLKHLHTPDLGGLVRAGRRQHLRTVEIGYVTDDMLSKYTLKFQAQEEAVLGLLGRAESIMHQKMVPKSLLASFKHVSGANLRRLEFTSPNNRSHSIGLATILRRFPNLESLTIHIDVFDRRGTLNPILDHDPTVGPDSASLPRLRKLVLIGSYDADRYGDGLIRIPPTFSPFMRLAQSFAETLQVLVFDIDTYTYDIGDDNSIPEDYVADEVKLEFDSPFPVLRRLVLQGFGAVFLDLLLSLKMELFPKLESCLCDLGPDDFFGDLSEGLEAAAHRLPVLQVAEAPSKIESMTDRLVEWTCPRIRAQSAETTPLESPHSNPSPEPDPLDPTARLQLTLDHLSEWVRSARDAQDVDAIAQIQAVLEGVDARRTLLDAWAGPTASKSKPENE